MIAMASSIINPMNAAKTAIGEQACSEKVPIVVQGNYPVNWHVPPKEEWNILTLN